MQNIIDIIKSPGFDPKAVANTVFMLKKVDVDLYTPLVGNCNELSLTSDFYCVENMLNSSFKW